MTFASLPNAYKTRAELTLERIESLKRPLTDEESDQLRRAMHAVYCRNRLARIRADEIKLLAKVETEAERTDPDFAAMVRGCEGRL